eukprot:1325786-Pleurochrysis_carterae.AAC.1
MHVNAAGGENDHDNADNNDMTDDSATLIALYKASGLPISLKGASLAVCPSAVKPRRPGDCIDCIRFLKLRGNSSGTGLPASGGLKFKNQRFKHFKLKSNKLNKTFFLGTDEDGNIFSLNSTLDDIPEGNESDCAKRTDDVALEAETNTVNTDGDIASATPFSNDNWQSDFFG